MKRTRFLFSLLIVWTTIVLSLRGGVWLFAGLVVTYSVMLLGDLLLGDERYANYEYGATTFFDTLLLAAVPSVLVMLSVLALMATSADGLLPLRAQLQALGLDLTGAAAKTQWWHLVGGVLGIGLVTGACGTCVAHELVHCFDSRVKRFSGRMLLAMAMDPAFAIDHIYGHHVHVATWSDATSARRGESSYHFLFRSIIDSNLNAWRLEATRLVRNKQAALSWRNQYLQNLALCAVLLVWAYALGGGLAVLLWVAAGLWAQGKVGLVNYVQHYGLVRVPGTRVEGRHAWNSNRWISSSLLINLYLHSQHHGNASLRFWELAPRKDVPLLPHGTLVMVLLAMTPNRWRSVMQAPLAAWDAQHATPEERRLLQRSALRLTGQGVTESA